MINGVRVNGRRRNALRFSARRLLQVLTRRSSELLDARREPGQVARRTADEQHGCSAGGPRRRRRRQHVVNLEVPVCGERNPRQVRIALDEGRDVFTNECGENLEAGRSTGRCHNERSADGVTPGEHEASPVNPDAPVDRHLGLEMGNRPYLARRLDSTNIVPVHDRGSRGRALALERGIRAKVSLSACSSTQHL
jgi:hypothetical protein